MAAMKPPRLVQISGCNPKERYKQWKSDGGALLNNKNIGCGINALTFLGVFDRAQGEHLVGIISPGGTSFAEMMAFVTRWGKHPLFEGTYPVTTEQDVIALELLLTNSQAPLLSPGHCTVAKFMRYADGAAPQKCNGQSLTSGHSVVLSNIDGKLNMIDPQQDTFREHKSDKAIKAWNSSCYTHVSLMFGHPERSKMEPAKPMKSEVFEQKAVKAFTMRAEAAPVRFEAVAAEVPAAEARFATPSRFAAADASLSAQRGIQAAQWVAAYDAEQAARRAAAYDAEQAARRAAARREAEAAAAKAAFDNPRVGYLVAAGRLRPPPAPFADIYDGSAVRAAERAEAAAAAERVNASARAKFQADAATTRAANAAHEEVMRRQREIQQAERFRKPHARGLQPSPLDARWGRAGIESRRAAKAKSAQKLASGGTLKRRKRNRTRYLRSS
jgi:hypothetical protein